jgi:hypothetical protein
MLERLHPILKGVCVVLAALVIYQLSGIMTQKDPLDNLSSASIFSAVPAARAESKPTNAIGPQGVKDSDIPAEVGARVERISKSEILGSLPRPPLPMALLGIAGKDAFVRAPNGQTGLLREGEELGGIKLLRIGTNRVLIQQGDEKKELTLFSGFGSEPLLPKGEKNTQ